MKSKPVLDDSLETQAVKFLKSVKPKTQESADAFLSRLATLSGDFSTHLIQSIVLLISSASQILTTAAIKMLSNLLLYCYPQNILLLIKADLIHQLIMTLNPLFLSFADAVHIHTSLLSIITITLRLATPEGLTSFRFKDDNEQQAVHDTVLKQVLVPSEKIGQEPANFSSCFWLVLDNPHCLCVIFVDSDITSCLPPSMVATLSVSFAATLTPLADTAGKHQKCGNENEGRRKWKWVDGGQGGWMCVREGRRVRRRSERGRGRESEVDDSPPAHLSACVRCGRRSSVSLCVALADDTTTDHPLSPHSSPNQTPTAPEGRTRLLLADLRESRTSEHCGVQTDRQNIDTADLATCHAVSAVAGVLGDTHHIVLFAHCMDGCCLVTGRTAGGTVVPVDSTAAADQKLTMTVLYSSFGE
ncbi:hypothetical protein BLNAU_5913 [Blattamonas nauphoetae]|uniref:Uncharacterized protein n=1 Tax=Blattamonas nauphoetae TaxID=2049346 RepID=A0ABQ9Y5W6_9EUKA|nr:hypothetical protein BLNAU_5913 [Blattamonas nauphoetae]